MWSSSPIRKLFQSFDPAIQLILDPGQVPSFDPITVNVEVDREISGNRYHQCLGEQ